MLEERKKEELCTINSFVSHFLLFSPPATVSSGVGSTAKVEEKVALDKNGKKVESDEKVALDRDGKKEEPACINTAI